MVTTATKTSVHTIEDLLLMQDDAEYELWKGELVEMPAAGGEASSAAMRIGRKIGNFLDEHDFGMLTGADGGYLLFADVRTLVAPDVGFVRWERLPERRQPRGFVPFAPDFAVEVISPTDRPGKIAEKQALYDEARVPLVWWVDLDRRLVRVRRPGQPERVLREGDVLDGEEILPGFRLPVTDIFR